jgi:hypothetical protein
MKRTAWLGSRASNTDGARAIHGRPAAAIARNQISMAGPKMAPIPAVPRRWIRNNPATMTNASGTMNGRKMGVATSSPSTALNTDTAGVITASP